MGIGYVFNEEALFARDTFELNRMEHTESLVTCEECAFLSIDISVFNDMIDLDGMRERRGTSPHMMEDQDLLWELFERHYFVKSTLRLEEGLISGMPPLRDTDWEKRETLNRRRRNSPNKRPILMP